VVSSSVHVAQQALRNTGLALLALSGLLRLLPGAYDWLVTRLATRLATRLNTPLQRLSAAFAPGAAHGDGAGSTGGFVLGMSLGAVWTPCAGPVLASILVLVVKAQDPGWSALLLALYSIGAAVPMLAIIYGGNYVTQRVRVVGRHAPLLQRAFGLLVVASAVAMYLQYDVLFYARISAFFPALRGL
jgi:cytochrome c biogenesis protein CcdA